MSWGRFLAKRILSLWTDAGSLGDDKQDLPGIETCFGFGFAYSVLDANAKIGTADVIAPMV